MLNKKPDLLTVIITSSIILVILLIGYLIFIILKFPTPPETVLYSRTKITAINPDNIVTEDTTIKLDRNISIQLTPATIPFAFEKNAKRQIPSQIVTAKDLKVGDTISVSSRKNQTIITLLDTITAFNGIVTKISEKSLTVNSFLPQTPGVLYTVNLANNAEITHPEEAQPVEIRFSNIKEGDRVNVYTNEDITRTIVVTAYKLDLIPQSNP